MPSRKRSPTKKNGTCKHCGHRMKGGWSFFGPTDPNKPSMFSGLFGKNSDDPAPVVPPPVVPAPVTQESPNTDGPQNAVPVNPPADSGQLIKKTGPGGRGGSETKIKPLFGIMGGKSKKSKNNKNSKSKKSKKSKK